MVIDIQKKNTNKKSYTGYTDMVNNLKEKI